MCVMVRVEHIVPYPELATWPRRLPIKKEHALICSNFHRVCPEPVLAIQSSFSHKDDKTKKSDRFCLTWQSRKSFASAPPAAPPPLRHAKHRAHRCDRSASHRSSGGSQESPHLTGSLPPCFEPCSPGSPGASDSSLRSLHHGRGEAVGTTKVHPAIADSHQPVCGRRYLLHACQCTQITNQNQSNGS